MVEWHHQLNEHEFDQTPGDGEGQGSLVCCSPWGRKESDTTEQMNKNNKWIQVPTWLKCTKKCEKYWSTWHGLIRLEGGTSYKRLCLESSTQPTLIFLHTYFWTIQLSILLLLLFLIYVYLFIFLFLAAPVFITALRLYPVMMNRGLSLLWFLLLQSTDSRHSGFSSCGLRALESWLNSSGMQA